MADQQIVLDASPNQQFSIALAVDGNTITLQIAIRFNAMAGYWVMTVADANANVLLDSIPLITGVWPAANILSQYAYLGIGSAYIVAVGSPADDFPGETDLGTDWYLIWSDTVKPMSASQAAQESGAIIESLSAVGSGVRP